MAVVSAVPVTTTSAGGRNDVTNMQVWLRQRVALIAHLRRRYPEPTARVPA